jgi:hypothetical protein
MSHKEPVPIFQQPTGDLNEKVLQITEYLGLLCEHLKDLLQNLGVENINPVELESFISEISKSVKKQLNGEVVLKRNAEGNKLDIYDFDGNKLGSIVYTQE